MKLLKKDTRELDNKTPQWFKLWHAEYFKPSDARGKRNEKWLYFIITAIIGTSILGEKYVGEVVALLKSFLGGV